MKHTPHQYMQFPLAVGRAISLTAGTLYRTEQSTRRVMEGNTTVYLIERVDHPRYGAVYQFHNVEIIKTPDSRVLI